LEAVHLPVDTARDWSYCEPVGQAAGALLTVEVLFGIEHEVDTITNDLRTETESVASTLSSANCAIGDALTTASDFWCVQRVLRFTGLVGNLGEYLAVCAT
jgi:hypothetical protein